MCGLGLGLVLVLQYIRQCMVSIIYMDQVDTVTATSLAH